MIFISAYCIQPPIIFGESTGQKVNIGQRSTTGEISKTSWLMKELNNKGQQICHEGAQLVMKELNNKRLSEYGGGQWAVGSGG